jgi:hypothetical protein
MTATARKVHAVLAAGVENPALIARWRHEPELLRGYGVEPAEVDLDALWKFAGLTIKVRHNGLRDDLPLTFRLMSVAGIEIDLFAAYAGARAAAGARLAPTTEGRTLELIAFLAGWLDRDDPVHALLWDVIRHERAVAQLARATLAPAGSAPVPAARATARTVPRVRGELVLHEMTCDPRAVAGALHASLPRLAAIPRAPAYLCYWRADAAPAIAILTLDALGFYALSRIDGSATAAAVHRAVGGAGRTSPGFLRALEQLAALGVIVLGAPAVGGVRDARHVRGPHEAREIRAGRAIREPRALRDARATRGRKGRP